MILLVVHPHSVERLRQHSHDPDIDFDKHLTGFSGYPASSVVRTFLVDMFHRLWAFGISGVQFC